MTRAADPRWRPTWSSRMAHSVGRRSRPAHRRASTGQALYRHLAGLAGVDQPRLPLPMVNVLSGGAHARRGMDVQDFLAIPVGATCLDEALSMAARVRTAAGTLLAREGISLLLADEGGFAPAYELAEQALHLMVRAIEAAGLRP